jgi:hypothetical protein
MIPIFFPHTYLSCPVMEAVQACFSPVVLYQPSAMGIPPPLREWEKTGQVDLRVPVPAEEEKLASLLTDFRNWAALGLFQNTQGQVAVFRRDIRRVDPGGHKGEEPDRDTILRNTIADCTAIAPHCPGDGCPERFPVNRPAAGR